MPGANLGTTNIPAFYLGSTPVTSIYLGAALVWTLTNIRDDFDRANADTLGSDWTSESGAAPPWDPLWPLYEIAVVNNMARVGLPDGWLTYGWINRVARYTADTAPFDDGYIEVRVGSDGSPPNPFGDRYWTSVYAKSENAGGGDSGVGFSLEASQLKIVRRLSGENADMLDCGSYTAGDILRLTYSGTLYTMTRNGAFVGEWNDSGASVNTGTGYRSLLVSMWASKDLFGPRRFSPSLDYVQMG